jgi:hypothetical protein
MKNRDSAGKRREGVRGVTVGRERFGKISAVREWCCHAPQRNVPLNSTA